MTSDHSTGTELLEARVRGLEDRRAIRNVLAKYSFTIDGHMLDEFQALFTEDAVFEYPAYEGNLFENSATSGSHVKVYRGRAEIRAILETATNESIRHRCQHYAVGGPEVIEIDGDRSTCHTYYSTFVVDDVDDLTPASQKYSFAIWTFVREGGAWKISGHRRRRMGGSDQGDVLRLFPFS